ncbi:MAG: AraC family transcriptional regulator, partial [Clostridiales bacterium]|nr:AraC family transcriptional regulator [Clostridiales bacterium]
MYDTIYKKDILNLMNDGILIYSAVYDFKKGNVPVYAGHVGDNSCYVTSSHMHDRFEVVLITEGSARYKVNMQWYTAQKGDLVIVNPYELHYGEVNKNVGFFSYVCFMCDLKFMERENAVYPYRFIKEIADGKTKITNYVPEHDGNGLNLFIKDAYEAHLKRPDDWSVLVNAHLLGFFSGLSERKLIAASAAPNEHNRFVKDVIDYILNNYRRPITSADGAAALGFNNSYFCRAFKKYFYTTFGEYLYDFRLNQSKILIDLLDRADNIRSIAKKVGFSSYNYFSSAFHEKFGIQPSVYRRTLQNSALHIA